MAELAKQEVVRIIYLYAADLMDEGMAIADIRNNLVERGLSPQSADTVIGHLMRASQSVFAPMMEDKLDASLTNPDGTQIAMPTRPIRAAQISGMNLRESESAKVGKLLADAVRRAGNRDMVIGALAFIVGLLITIGTFAVASSGGTYIVAYGALIFGPVMFVRGIIRLNKARKLEESETDLLD